MVSEEFMDEIIESEVEQMDAYGQEPSYAIVVDAAVEQLKFENEQLQKLMSVRIDMLEQNKNMTAEIIALKSRLLDFEGRTFSENQEIAALKSKLKIAVDALEYYSSGDNWNHINPGVHYVTNVYPCVDETDCGDGDFLISERMNVDDTGVGGKKARQALTEIGGEI